MNETTILIALLSGAVAAIGTLGSAAIGYAAKKRETAVKLTELDREWITRLQERIDELDEKVGERDRRIDALEGEIDALHRENAELRSLLIAHKITPPRPRLRPIPSPESA